MIFIAACGVGAWFWIGVNRATASPSLVVLPFKPADDHLAIELTDGLTATFARNKGLRVIDKETAATVKDFDLHKISRILYADSVLQGEVARLGGKIRIATRLQRTTDRSTQWAGSWEGPANEIQVAESEIVAGVTRAMHAPRADPR